jgi:hypothetical protein
LRTRHALPLLAVAAFVVGGCGGSKPLSHAAFAAKANAVCRAQRAKVVAVPRPGALLQFQAYLAKVLPLVRAERDGVAKLKPPKSDRPRVDRLLARWDNVVGALDRMQGGAKSGDDALIALGLRGAHAADAQATAAAGSLGVGACAPFSPFSK